MPSSRHTSPSPDLGVPKRTATPRCASLSSGGCTRGPDRVTFSTAVGRDATFHTGLRTTGRTTYAIEWQRGTSRRVLAHGAVEGPTSIACAYPTGTGVISPISDHPVTWVDPRVVRDLSLWPTIWALGLLVLAWLARGAGLTRRAFATARSTSASRSPRSATRSRTP